MRRNDMPLKDYLEGSSPEERHASKQKLPAAIQWADDLRMVAMGNCERRRYKEAYEQLREARRVYGDEGDAEGFIRCNIQIALLLEACGRAAVALDLYEKTVWLCQ